MENEDEINDAKKGLGQLKILTTGSDFRINFKVKHYLLCRKHQAIQS
jgi:hypothetical protein